MLRSEIELLMKEKEQKSINLIYNKDDHLACYCFLQGGYLVDHTGHRVDRKKDIWGYMVYEDGQPIIYAF